MRRFAFHIAFLFAAALPAFCQGGTWTTQAPMPTPRGNAGAGVVNGILYAVGGCAGSCVIRVNEAYDSVSNTWTTKAPIPNTTAQGGVQQGFNFLGVSVINGVLYATGDRNGTFYSMGLLSYNPISNSWTEKASPPSARSSFGVGAANGIFYAIGGSMFNNGSFNYLSTVETYDPVSDIWTPKTQMPTPRDGLAIGVVNGLIYAVGGWNGSPLSTVEAYDPVSDTWTTKAPMTTARAGMAVAVIKGILYAAGGQNGVTALSTVEAYDPASDTWTTVASLPTATYGAASAVAYGKMYVVGGPSLATNQAFTPIPQGVAQLVGGNAFIGDQFVNGIVTATKFLGDGSGLTGIVASNASALGGLPPSAYQPAGNYARRDTGNTFAGNQSIVGNVAVSGLSTFTSGPGSTISATNSAGGLGVAGFSASGIGTYGEGAAGVRGIGNHGVEGITTVAAGYGGWFENDAGGTILVGRSNAGGGGVTEKFSIAGNGNVTTSGKLTAAGAILGPGATFSASFPALKPVGCSALTFTLAGATDGDTVTLGVPNALMTAAGIPIYTAWVSAANTITIRACNLDPNVNQKTGVLGVIRVDVWKH